MCIKITYTVQYQYGTYSGKRKITLRSDDLRDPCKVMWARMEWAGELTLPMAYRSARIIDEQPSEDNERYRSMDESTNKIEEPFFSPTINQVSHEENEAMTDPMKTDALPRGMALVETDDGRWFAAFAPDGATPRSLLVLLDATTALIPPALDQRSEACQGYSCREEAIEAYHAWHEAAALPVQWQTLAASTEIYPERNAWYLAEIARLTGDSTPRLSCGIDVSAVVMTDRSGSNGVITAAGTTIDEAVEALYQCVYRWYCQEPALQACERGETAHPSTQAHRCRVSILYPLVLEGNEQEQKSESSQVG